MSRATASDPQDVATFREFHVVVLDPADRAQIERFARAYEATWATQSDQGTVDIIVRQMQAALYSMFTPPKVEEPTGLGAVVADAEDVCYVRGLPVAASLDPQRPWWVVAPHGDRAARWLSWDEFTAVTVIAPGVPA